MFYSHHTLLKNARFLIGLAWAVEIIAVLIGLTISIVVPSQPTRPLPQRVMWVYSRAPPLFLLRRCPLC